MSETFSFRTEPVAIRADNVLTLRLMPANLGQAFFSSQQTGFDESGFTVQWRGIAIRYDRENGPSPSGSRGAAQAG
jgi:hypothetical protein